MTKSIEEQIAENKERIKRMQERNRKLMQRQSEKERKARTRRLIEVGAIVEKAHGSEYDERDRQTLSQGLNGIISVYDPKRGGNVDMRVIDVIHSGIPTAPEEHRTRTDATPDTGIKRPGPTPQPDQPRSFTPNPQRIEHRQENPQGRWF